MACHDAGNGRSRSLPTGIPARCLSCPFYRLGRFNGLRAVPGDPWRCDLVPGQAYGRTLLAPEGATPNRVFAVRTGLGRVFRTLSSGRVVALRLVRPGELVGTEGLSGDEYAASFESLGDLQYCAGDPEQIRARASADPDLATEVQALAEQEMESYRQRIVSLSVLDRRGRVAEFLLDMEDATSGANGWAELLLAQQEAAELLGSTQETVSRVLGEMVRNRWIERRGRRFRILHREAVRASASGDLPKPAPGRHLLLPAG